MDIKIIDSRMGTGKTSYAIQYMNNNPQNKYVYITPFLKEVDRIKQNCKYHFHSPENIGNGKQDKLHYLLEKEKNIASTHALFRMSNDVTQELINSSDYVLILDEVMDVIEKVNLKKDDIPSLLSLELITIQEDGLIIWNDEDYNGAYNYIKTMALNKTLYMFNNTFLMWHFPADIFKSFKEVYILTYMFKGQIQRYYYDLFSLDYKYYSVGKVDDKYDLMDYHNSEPIEVLECLKSRINIFDDQKMNAIGEKDFSLSSTWYSQSKNLLLLKKMKNNTNNYLKNIHNAKGNDIIWTTFKASKSKISGNGYSRSFVSSNARATNEYGSRHYLVYCINVFLDPIKKNFFIMHDVDVEEDIYALSEMLQWIWRSAIRNDESIYIYIPSKRMRNLLEDYLNGNIR